MSRFASALNEAAAAGNSVKLFVACDLDFASGHYRANDTVHNIAWGGNTYEGVGSFGGIEDADESIDLIARPLKLTLSGVPGNQLPADHVGTAVDERYQDRDAVIYLGIWNDTKGELIDTPEILWEGVMDQMLVSLGAGIGSVLLNCEHRLRREPRIARYTDADQQLAYSGDRFFDLVPKIAGFKGKWGSKDVLSIPQLGRTGDFLRRFVDNNR
jgi:hypothetical protein